MRMRVSTVPTSAPSKGGASLDGGLSGGQWQMQNPAQSRGHGIHAIRRMGCSEVS